MKHIFPQWIVFGLVGYLAFGSCSKSKVVYDSYLSTPVDGWEQNDEMVFALDTIQQTGTYGLSVGVRTTNKYPFQSLWLLVTQEYYNPRLTRKDTLECVLYSKEGDIKGTGVSLYQYEFPLKRHLFLYQGQAGMVNIKHIMRKEILPGISDVGIKLITLSK